MSVPNGKLILESKGKNMTPKQLKWKMATIVYQANMKLEAERKALAEKESK